MQSQKLTILFQKYCCSIRNMQKVPTANACLTKSKGTRVARKARKYRRPEDLEDPNYYGVGPRREVKLGLQSIADRGFAKERPSYNPPDGVDVKLQKICQKVFGSSLNASWKDQQLSDPLLKFKVLTKCIETFKKDIPSIDLHSMKTVKDLVVYFETAIDGTLHYDALLRESEKLPPNLHLIRESVRFNPSTDTFFDGVTAYPHRRRTVYTKTGEKFEKIIEWPHL